MSGSTSENSAKSEDTTPVIIKTVEYNKAYQSDDADFTIISSDGVSFGVYRVALLLGSSVFKDMLSMPSNDNSTKANSNDVTQSLTLYDSEIENAASVKIFLDLIYSHPVPKLTSDSFDSLVPPLKMIQKYDCPGAKRLVLYALQSALARSGVSSIYTFIVAAILDDLETCILAIKASDNSVWSQEPELPNTLQHEIPLQDVFDVRAMPMTLAALIPFKYSFALMRARLEVEMEMKASLANRPSTKDQVNRCATAFARIMA